MTSVTKLLLCMLVSALLSLSLVGCGATDSTGSVNGLTIMGYSSNLSNVYMQRIFAAYEKATGTKLNIIGVENENMDREVARALTGDAAPDIFMHFNNAALANIEPANHFVSLKDQPWVADLTDSALAYAQDQSGDLFGLPFWESSVSGCYYNKAILDKLGLKPATTQAEFDQLCTALKTAGITPLVWGDAGVDASYQFGLDPIFADNPDLLDQLNTGKIAFSDIPQVRSMVEWLKHANDAGWFGDTINTPYDELSNPLAKGDAAMIFIWDTWFDTDFQNGAYTSKDFALMPIFMGSANDGTYEGGNLNMMMVNKNSEKRDKAMEFLAFCANPENYNKAFDGIATVNVFKGQNTNVQSPMVLDAAFSVSQYERPSTAQPKIHGYNPSAIAEAFHKLFTGAVDVDGCIALLDDSLKQQQLYR